MTGVVTVAVGNQPAWLRKYDTDGNVDWTSTYGSPQGAVARGDGLAIDSNGEIAVAGYASFFDLNQGNNAWIGKFSADGDLVWTEHYGDPGNVTDHARGVTVDGIDRLGVVGTSDGDIVVRRYTEDGGNGWIDTETGTSADNGNGVVADSAGDLFVVGDISTASGTRGWVRKYSSAGAPLWTVTLDGANASYANAVAVDADDTVVVVGRERVGGVDVAWIRRYDADGAELASYDADAGGVSLGIGAAVQVDEQGAIIVGGSAGADSASMALIKLGPDGSPLWGDSLNLGVNETILGVDADDDGSLAVCGFYYDIQDGAVAWIRKYTG